MYRALIYATDGKGKQLGRTRVQKELAPVLSLTKTHPSEAYVSSKNGRQGVLIRTWGGAAHFRYLIDCVIRDLKARPDRTIDPRIEALNKATSGQLRQFGITS